MTISAGNTLGPYQILWELGRGGMGQVWKARDTRLNRIVAIKTSHDHFSERFAREARAIAAINHPHVCSLYDVGPDYLVMEYVEGKPLLGPLPINEALLIAAQILDALDAAHQKGIIHRDLKPGNILIGKNGVKVLDFGIAKFAPTAAGHNDPTALLPLSGENAIIGTLQYMSPEQLEGKPADARSDVFAFGVVLYEVITGRRPFTGASQSSLIAAVLKEEPRPIRELEPSTPVAIERVVLTCLEKDPDKRWQSAREVKHALNWMAEVAPTLERPVQPFANKTWKAAAVLIAVAVLGIANWMFWPKAAPTAKVTRFRVAPPENVVVSEYLSLSPDGRKLAFNAAGNQGGVWVRDLDALQWRRLPGTEDAEGPFWSPDSRYIGFGVQKQLKRVDASGGTVQTLCEIADPVGMGSWSPDGVIIFGSRGRGPIRKVSQSGGMATEVTAIDASHGETFHALPTLLPDGKHFLYLRYGPPKAMGLYVGSVDAKPDEQSRNRILQSQFAGSYADGRLFFMRENTLMSQQFDSSRLQMTGEPVVVAEHVGTTRSIGLFGVSSSGTLAYRPDDGGESYQLTWFDRRGRILYTVGPPAPNFDVALSPDGTRAVVRDTEMPKSGDLWTLDLARSVRTRVTFQKKSASAAVWSPDGTRIAFAEGDTLYEKASSGAGEAKELGKYPGKIPIPTSWSHDGRFLLYHTLKTAGSSGDLWLLPVGGDGKSVLLLGTDFEESQGSFSPDMRWIAYVSDESGMNQVYVRPFTVSGKSGAPSLAEGKWQVSRDGGDGPSWTADGKEIIFQAPPDGTSKMAVQVKANGRALQAGVPKTLFQAPLDYGWDITPDGSRLLLSIRNQPSSPITVVLNWQAELKQ